MKRFIAQRPGQSGILYCIWRTDTEGLGGTSRVCGINAKCYHAGLHDQTRRKAQEWFMAPSPEHQRGIQPSDEAISTATVSAPISTATVMERFS